VSKASKRERQRLNREARRQYEEALARRRRAWRTTRRVVPLAVLGVVAVTLLTVSGGSNDQSHAANIQYATFTTSMGNIVVQLDGREAPKSEAQFVRLAKAGFYDGLTIHRVSTGAGVIQGGDPKGNGTGGSGTTVPDELPKSAYKLGDLAFANSGPNTSDSQWFIVTSDVGTKLPLSFNRFGHVIRGLDIAQEIQALVPASGDGPPTTPVTVTKITISKKPPPNAPNVTTLPTTTTTAGATPKT
jgi:cyclophilin family peptidyl-prolyl cis-trans isomerase